MATRSESVRGTSVLLDHMARLMRVHADSALAEVGLRPRHLRALTLLRDGGEVTQQGLAERLSMDRTNLVGLLNELEAEGLIERRRSTEDRRRHIVVLTDAGAARLGAGECALASTEDAVLSALDPRERQALHDMLSRAASGLAASCSGAVEDPEPGC